GTLADRANSIAVDSSGNACIAGRTNSPDFPLSNQFQSQLLGDYDAFVAKLSADGTALLFSTYFGGSGNDEGAGIAVDSSGMIYVTGATETLSQFDFVTTTGAFQRTYGGGMNDAYVAKFDATQPGPATLVYSTFLGGGDRERGNSIAVDSAGNAYVAGRTGSSDFPLMNPLQPSFGGGTYDAFVSELSADGSTLIYSTYLGDVGTDQAYGIAVDSAGNAYVTGVTSSSNFPTMNAYQPTLAGGTDVFVSAIMSGGGALMYSTYLGGSGTDLGSGLALDASGIISVTGRTASQNDFPETPDAIQPTFGGGPNDAFVAKFNPALSGPASLVYSSYLGGSGDEDVPTQGVAGNPAGAIAVDPAGNVYATGNTSSADFPTLNPYQAAYHGADAFVTVIRNTTTMPDYTVSVTPASVTVPAGSPASYTVTVTPLAGFTGTVSLTVTGVPTDAMASFNPASVVISDTTAQTSALTVSTAVTTPAGTFPLSVTGTSGALQHTSPAVSLVVTSGTSPNVTVTMGAWPSPVMVGTNLTYEIRVTNMGPGMVTGVQLTDTLPTGSFQSAVPTQGTCTASDAVACDLGGLDVGARATVTIMASTSATGSLSNTATVTSDQSTGQSATTTVEVVQSGGVPVDVLQHHLHATRDGLYTDPLITQQAAMMTHRDLSFTVSVPGPVYAQPLYVTNGPAGAAAYIVATEQNIVEAIDASDGSQLWQVNPPAAAHLGTPVPRPSLNCGDIDPVGITGTPVIDPDARLIFLDAMSTPDAGATKQHLIYALSLDDGSTQWMVDVSTLSYNGLNFDPSAQNQRGALLLNAGMLYVPYGGHFGDCTDFDGTPYHGWVVAVPETNPTGAVAWATDGSQAGIWSVGGLTTDGTSLFAATGNTSQTTTTWSGGEAIIRLGLDDTFSGNPADFFTPSNWSTLDQFDLDLGGAAPLIVDVPGATPSRLIVALGKSGVAYLLDRDNLGGIGTGDGENGEGLFSTRVAADNPIGTPPRGRIRAPAATYTTASGTYVVFAVSTPGSLGVGCPGTPGDLVALRISAASPPTVSVAWCANDNGQGQPFAGRGAPIVTTTDGSSQPVVWTIGAEGNNQLLAYDGETGAPLFTSEQMTQVRRFMTPISVNGRIIVVSDGTLYVFTTR
ncbi:MAG TPA: SBBP repeat-containing protein, partial [Vicinamibacterales bacterium]